MNFISYVKRALSEVNELLMQSDYNATKYTRGNVFRIKSRGHIYYVKELKIQGKRKRKYLGKIDSEKLKQEKEIQLSIERRKILLIDKKVLEDTLSKYIPCDKPTIEHRISPCLLNVECDFSFDLRMKGLYEWSNAYYEKNNMPFPDKVILTKDGTRMRSKDECTLYDLFKDAGVPFRNDCIMIFDDPFNPGHKIRKAPDFVIMTFSGKLIIVEHAGLLLKQSYAVSFTEKIQIYLYNGYVLGDNLFITSCDKDGGVNVAALQRLVEEIIYRMMQ